ncbi:MAG: hypothetical protein M0R46_04785 [Candidatus Muirbacterium halophilum]|nr:hypothetical protein [Candidatus Muirbacterium halophilum]MCK9475212.1 hypothetical protein [Candidatus Muirbacterium halophilum]
MDINVNLNFLKKVQLRFLIFFYRKWKRIRPFKNIEKMLVEYGIYIPNKKRRGRPSIPARILIHCIT